MKNKPSNKYLTTREKEVLRAAARGRSYEQIAIELDISPNTVDSHLKSIRTRLEVGSTFAAVMSALSNGIIAI